MPRPVAIVLILVVFSAEGGFRLRADDRQGRRSSPEILAETPRGVAILDAEDSRARTAAGLNVLVRALQSEISIVRSAAVRALGRLERRDVVPSLLTITPIPIDAVAQAMRGPRLLEDRGEQVEAVLTRFLRAAAGETSPGRVASFARALGRLPYDRADQVLRAEEMLLAMLQLSTSLLSVQMRDPQIDPGVVMSGAAEGLELLARTQRTLYGPSERTIELLRAVASGSGPTVGSMSGMLAARLPAFRALIAVRGVDAESLPPNLTSRDEWIRRLAFVQLGGAASPITGDERAGFLRQGLSDASDHVRFEALRGYARHQVKADGCLLVLQMVSDTNGHVALAAIDALGDVCAGDEDAILRLASEARTPPHVGRWQREAHALVALAKLSPEQASVPLMSHMQHNTWQVRMYAARAAAAANDLATLERLALDEHDNVREATLGPLKRLKGDEAEPAFLAALSRDDYQLLRTAARELAGMRVSRFVPDALVEALLRVTAQRRETSRDTRIALLERLREHGSRRYAERLQPLLRDFDPRVAEETAATIDRWTGLLPAIDPQPLPRQPLPAPSELALLRSHVAVIVLESGREIELQLDAERAPLTSTRFLRLASANYYDGLTFHRVVPNFVVQGGSPGANEYVGDGPYLRDEISARPHRRGTVGLSTRGRDTGDAQFFINLVDNPRLDFEYTVFGAVTDRTLALIDDIQEGDGITDIRFRRAR